MPSILICQYLPMRCQCPAARSRLGDRCESELGRRVHSALRIDAEIWRLLRHHDLLLVTRLVEAKREFSALASRSLPRKGGSTGTSTLSKEWARLVSRVRRAWRDF